MIGDLELWVAEHAEGLVFVHAGAVAWGGRAIVVPGRTLAGKSTLVAALVRAGATYYSDEYTVLDPQGMVRPYARMLSIRPTDGGPPHRVTAEAIGGHTGTEPVPMALVAHLRYDPGAGWAVEELSRGRDRDGAAGQHGAGPHPAGRGDGPPAGRDRRRARPHRHPR